MTDSDLKAQMAQFEAARTGEPLQLEPAELRQVLAVRDGSTEDPAVLALARAIGTRTGAQVRELAVAAGDPVPAVLAAAQGCQLVVVQHRLGETSGSGHDGPLPAAIESLLARCPAALCLARAPFDEHFVSHPLVALQIERQRKVEATAMALALARNGGELALLSVVDPSQPVRNEELLRRYIDPQDLSPEVLQGLATARAAILTAALQRRSREWKVRVLVKFAVGDAIATALEAATRRRSLLVAGRAADQDNAGAQRARQLVQRCTVPLLLV